MSTLGISPVTTSAPRSRPALANTRRLLLCFRSAMHSYIHTFIDTFIHSVLSRASIKHRVALLGCASTTATPHPPHTHALTVSPRAHLCLYVFQPDDHSERHRRGGQATECTRDAGEGGGHDGFRNYMKLHEISQLKSGVSATLFKLSDHQIGKITLAI